MKQTSNLCQNILKLRIVAIFVTVFVVVIIEREYICERISVFSAWMVLHPVLGPFVLSVVIMLGEVFFIPGTLLKIGAGYAFKSAYKNIGHAILIGSLSAWLGISFGAILTFMLGRFVFKEQALKMAKKYPLFKALDKAIESEL